MTDSNATELRELCEMLDERGIEWTKGDASYEIEWTNPNGQHCSAMWWKPTLTVLMSGCTPEQAVATTLKNELNPDGLPVGLTISEDGNLLNWRGENYVKHAVAATLGAEECEPKWTLQGTTQTQEFWRCDCGNCGYEFGVEDRRSSPWSVVVNSVDVPNYCPECGAKQKAVKR